MTANTMKISILDHCPECNPRNHLAESSFTATDQSDDIAEETLYTCDDCGARVWIAYD